MAGNEYEYRIGDEWDGIEIPEWAERERALREKLAELTREEERKDREIEKKEEEIRKKEEELRQLDEELRKKEKELRQLKERLRQQMELLLRIGVNPDDIPDSPS